VKAGCGDFRYRATKAFSIDHGGPVSVKLPLSADFVEKVVE
jgi:hypothetical protein